MLKTIATTTAALAIVLAGALAVPASASVPEGGDTRPCVTWREFNHVGWENQTRSIVRQIVDTPGVVVSDHAFDGWNADAGVPPKDEYGAAPRYREIRSYPMCGSGHHVMFVEYRVRYGTSRTEQVRYR